ncbi:MAG: helix-turn-helix domain-containing protein [Bdellovibrionaceae bacterium]|nr:helix-turn-helix domain-containing protein [Pseudobdellovibrionaceae bacterium]
MTYPKVGTLKLNNKDYLIVSTEDFKSLDTNLIVRGLAIPPLNKITIGYLIRQHRLLAGQTQSELGKRLGIGQKHIDKIENNKIKRPSDSLLRKTIEEFGSNFEDGLKLIGINLKY